MPRHHPSNVVQQLSALVQNGYLKRPPPAYNALVNHPPTALPLRQPNPRPDEDLPLRWRRSQPTSTTTATTAKARKPLPPRPLPIQYPELDALRAAFYRDHPFEAYRPVSLVESGHALAERVAGEKLRKLGEDGRLVVGEYVGIEEWRELRQKTLYPSAEDCLAFAFALHTHHPSSYSLNASYSIAVSQFRTLRFEADTSSSSARQEAESYGAVWKLDRIGRQTQLQAKWLKDQTGMATSLEAQAAMAGGWSSMVAPLQRVEQPFSAGKEHMARAAHKTARLHEQAER